MTTQVPSARFSTTDRGPLRFEGVTAAQNLLLVLPLRAVRCHSQIFVDAQARNGLRLWLDNFDVLTLACPTEDGPVPVIFCRSTIPG